jgi:hypothetical protein
MTLTLQEDAPASGLACPRCLAPLPDRERTEVQTVPAARAAPSPSRLAAEEFVNQGRRDSDLGAAAIGGVVLLCVFGLVVLFTKAEPFLPLFGLLDLVVVVILTVWFSKGRRDKLGESSAHPLSGCAIPLIFLGLLGAGFVFFFVVCSRVFLSGPLH